MDRALGDSALRARFSRCNGVAMSRKRWSPPSTAFAVCPKLMPPRGDTMDSKYRLTAQGIRDLNYSGPRKVPAAVVTPEGATVEPAVEPAAVEPAAPIAIAE